MIFFPQAQTGYQLAFLIATCYPLRLMIDLSWMADSAIPCCDGAVVLEPGADLLNLPQIIMTPEPVRSKAATDLPIRWTVDRLQLLFKTLKAKGNLFFDMLVVQSFSQWVSRWGGGATQGQSGRSTDGGRWVRIQRMQHQLIWDLTSLASIPHVFLFPAGGALCQQPVWAA